MSELEAIENRIRSLSRKEAEMLQDWLSDFLEEDTEVSADFAASIDRGKADLEKGHSRVRETPSSESTK